MGLKCRIKFNDTGVATVFNNDGSPSSLYNQLLEEVKDQKKAITIWASASLPEFQNETGKTVDTATLPEVLDYYNFKAQENNSLTASEKESVAQFMNSHGFNTLTDLQASLKQVFNSDGNYKIDRAKAEQFGYDQDTIDELNIESIVSLIGKIDNYLVSGQDMILPSQDSQVTYTDESKKSIFGTKVLIPEDQIYSEIIQELGNDKTVEEAASSLPYSTFVDSYKNSPTFKSKVDEKFSNVSIIPTAYINNGELTKVNFAKKEEILNTLIDNADVISIGAELEYLSNIDPDVWDFKLEAVREVIKEIEETFAQSNIDIIGLNNFVSRREDVLDLISRGVAMANSTSIEDIELFANKYEELFGAPTELHAENLPTNYKNLQIVKVNSDLSQSELFRQFGLIKIGENLYHKVGNTPNSDLYEYIYRNLLDGTLTLPVDIDVNNKLQSIINIEQYVNSIPSNYDSDISEIIKLNQIVFNHQPLPQVNKASELNLIQTNPGYLRNGFISDFYNYILSEKIKDSEVYNNVLSKFSIRDNGITLIGDPTSIEGIQLQQELEDYIRLKKDTSMDYLLPTRTLEFVDEDLYYLNNPSFAPDVNAEYRRERDYLITRTGSNDWVKVGKELFKKVSSKGNTDVFLSVKTPANNLYFNISKNFDFDTKDAMMVLERNQFSEKEGDSETLQLKAEDRTHLQRVSQTSKDVTTLFANYVKTALDFDVNVLTKEQMQQELENRGYNLSPTQLFKNNEVVYGFYDNNTKQIMLTEDLLNVGTFVHELWHMYKPIVKDQALKGDQTAASLLDKFDSIASDLFKEDVFNQRFDNFLGKDNLSFNEDFQVIGERGIRKLSDAEQDIENLTLAKQLNTEGVDPLRIKNATGWELLNDEWVLEVPDLTFKVNEVILGKIYKLSEVVEDNRLIETYGDINIKFNDKGINGYSATETFIELDTEGTASNAENWASTDTSYNEGEPSPRLLRSEAQRALAHEFIHHIQRKEGFLSGGSFRSVIQTAYDIAGVREDDNSSSATNKLRSALDKANNYSESEVLNSALEYITSGYKSIDRAISSYTKLTGEVTAHAIEKRVGLPEDVRNNSLIQTSVDNEIPEWYRINFQAADLSSSVYDPRQGESREDYISRMKEEIEANLIGENATQYFENVAKEFGLTETQTKSFLQRIKDFIGEFSQWLANKLGFKALTRQQASELTTREFLDRVTTSILKDEYTEKVNNLQQILDSDLKIVYLYPESQDNDIKQEIDSCG